ncbi:PREDICTED: HAUS augmin-like complex subunit 3 [Nanorana parkeri]|uniref:HAUS augmin-like complex subunit 3 n=1 Tax=Nanorana parkeri TaxID=125878 RepID=UPI0008543017|nr:PREDICTED: HAUS augmin-like complex subunit 3 [Nanorana parkeri]
MSAGDRFVQTLRKLGYPNASKLEAEDFDWLFETTDAKAFLDWFCGTVTQQNVLSEEKLQAFKELKDSGKAFLDDKALDEVMKTFKPASSKATAKEEVAIEKLEEELQSLKSQRSLHLQRRNKLQMIGSANVHSCLKFKDREDEEAKLLNKTLNDLQVTSNKLNHELQTVVEGIQKLMSFYVPQEKGSTASSPIFLFQVLLDKYLSCEEQSTNALTLFTKEHFFEGLSKCIEGSENDFQLVQLDGNSGDDPVLEGKCKEMMRLQLAYISAKHKLIQTKAKRSSLVTGLQWVENNASAVQAMDVHKDALKVRISSLKEESSQIENRIAAINRDALPALVRERAQLLNMPVVKGDYDVQIAHHNLYLSRQDVVCDHLMKQKASFELLQLGYELELRKQRNVNRQLEMTIGDLRQDAERLETRLLMMSDDTLLSADKPRTNIDSKDTSSHGLFQLLDGDDTQKLFRTYSSLESVALKLSQEVHSVKNQLAVCEQEQSFLLSKLETNMKSLQDFMYPDGNELMLQTPEVSANFQHLHANLDKLNRILLEVLGDLKVKRKVLESSKFDKLEKQVYVYFFQNEELLKTVVESLESQTEVQSTT